MINKTFKSLLAISGLTLAVVGSAQAGGFSRGKADTQILYEEGNFNLRSSLTHVDVTKEYSKAANPAAVGEDFADSYTMFSAAAKFNITSNIRCAGTYSQPYGGSFSDKNISTFYGKTHEGFTIDELGATCAVKFDVGPGRAWLLGGGFEETFSYARTQDYSWLNAGNPALGGASPFTALGVPAAAGPGGYGATLNLKGKDYGYRLGAAYEIPEYAMRGEVLYRSATSHRPEGEISVPTGALCASGVAPAACLAPRNTQMSWAAGGRGELPQSVELNLQSGIAPGWLAFGSVKWMDWSVTKTLDVIRLADGATTSQDKFYWKDGWTVTGGIGHAFNEQVSGLVAVTWDRGVSTGYDMSGDTWTVSVGGSLKDKFGGELRGGLGYTYLESAAETKYGTTTLGPISIDQNRAAKAGHAIAGNIGYAIKW